MTCIAYDGRFVASDRLATSGVKLSTMQKLYKHENKVLAIDGHAGHGLTLIAWFKAGLVPSELPRPFGDTWANLNVFEKDKPVLAFEGGYAPLVHTDPKYGSGSGGSLAMGAMLSGKSAAEAVALANEWCDGCGRGVDVVDLYELDDQWRKACEHSGGTSVGSSGASLGATPVPKWAV